MEPISNAWAQSFCPRFDAAEPHGRHDWQHGPDDVRECPGYPIGGQRHIRVGGFLVNLDDLAAQPSDPSGMSEGAGES